MDKNEFYQNITEALQDKAGPDTKVFLHTVRKNNNVILQGVIFQNPGKNISPTIYLERFYEMYQDGTSLADLRNQIWDLYQNGCPKKSVEMDFFRNFEKIRDKIVYRLINAEKNKELLKEIPHILFLDLEICFYYAFSDSELGNGMIMIHNNHMDMWKTDYLQLMKLAKQNTPRLFPAEHMGLDLLMSLLNEKELRVQNPNSGLQVLTNKQKCQGAACILYQGELEKIAEESEGNLYLIPSSVHEMLLIKDVGNIDTNALCDMIEEINETQVDQEEILADHPYYYERTKRKITCLSKI